MAAGALCSRCRAAQVASGALSVCVRDTRPLAGCQERDVVRGFYEALSANERRLTIVREIAAFGVCYITLCVDELRHPRKHSAWFSFKD
jgi:hypothetical protein